VQFCRGLQKSLLNQNARRNVGELHVQQRKLKLLTPLIFSQKRNLAENFRIAPN